MAGLLDMITGGDNYDPKAIDPNTGLSNADKRQMMYNQMASNGFMLMALGQQLTPSQRADLLTKTAQMPNQQTQQMDVLSQARLRAAQAQAAQQQLQMQRSIMEQLTGAGNQPTAASAAAQNIASITNQGNTPPNPNGPLAARLPSATPPGQVAPPAAFADSMGGIGGSGTIVRAPLPNIPGSNVAPQLPSEQPQLGAAQPPMKMPALNPAQNTLTGGIPAVGAGVPTVPQVPGLQTMDPTGRMLTMMGAVKDPEGAGRTLNESNQWAKTPASITATSPNGQVQTIPTTNGQLAGMQAALTQQGWTLGERKPTGFQSELDKIDAKKMEDWSGARDQGQVAKARLADMADAATHFTPGRGTGPYMEMAGYLNNAFGTDAFADPQKMGSYDAFVKNSLQLVGAQVKDQEGARAAASLWTMLQKAQPTVETSPLGMQRMMRFMNAVIDFNTAKANAADDWTSKYGSLRANGKVFDKEFNNNVNFNKFLGQYMTPDEISALPPSLRKQYTGAE